MPKEAGASRKPGACQNWRLLSELRPYYSAADLTEAEKAEALRIGRLIDRFKVSRGDAESG